VYADRARLAALMEDEIAAFEAARPRSRSEWERAARHLPGGVPMLWMSKWPGPWPVYVASAWGSHFHCVDGIDHVDLCLGDTGAMIGHAPAAAVSAITAQLEHGATFMLPTRKSAQAGDLLSARFGLPYWQFTLSATDANRTLIRYARQVTGRAKILVHDLSYHGTVDETFATLDASGAVVARRGNIGAPVPLAETTLVVPFNDVAALETALATGEVAAVLIEPAMTNIGIVLPDPGYLDAMREACTRHGAVLIHDETHTLSAGPGGYTVAHGLAPDAIVLGKTIGGGVPAGVLGMSEELSNRVSAAIRLEDIDVGGVGGTLAGNALSIAGVVATLGEVLTETAYASMTARATEWTAGVQAVIDEFGAPWQVTQLGCRAEYSFRPSAPRDGREAAEADDFELQRYLHLHALNRGILMTPFHNMALMSPATTSDDVARHTAAFREAVASLYGADSAEPRFRKGVTMPRALVAVEYGGPEVLDVLQVSAREPGPGEVVIEVRASGINPVDAKFMSGGRGGRDPERLPLRLGYEASGVVTAVGGGALVGADEQPVSVGDEVVAFRIGGAHASEVTVPAKDVLQKPTSLSFERAAGLLLVSATAFHALEAVTVVPGDTVVIHGGAGSVGRAAIQLALRRAARVIATAAPGRHAELRELGAEPVAYGPGVEGRIRALADQVDAAIDTVGTQEALDVSLALLADPGRLVTIANGPAVQAAGGVAIGGGPGADPGTELRDLARAELVRLAAAGELVVPVVATYPLEEAQAAYELLAQGHAGGKIVLVP
jgi:glutamate-1-semialdehyde aminotransferase/NADPH:quinone reductase-like Zn-dependent oxidoreductase